jgi:hypothetical protein
MPESEISDANVEHYRSGLPALTPGEHTIAVRVHDRFQNIGSARITFEVPAGK